MSGDDERVLERLFRELRSRPMRPSPTWQARLDARLARAVEQPRPVRPGHVLASALLTLLGLLTRLPTQRLSPRAQPTRDLGEER